MNGMSDLDNMLCLQVNGVSQLNKEINETMNLKEKTIDTQALYRNEETGECEEGREKQELNPSLLEIYENDSDQKPKAGLVDPLYKKPRAGFVDPLFENVQDKNRTVNEILY